MNKTRSESVFHSHRLDAGTGQLLSVRLYRPADRMRGGVLMVGAMGVPQRFYGALAAWLAEQGYLTVTFDFGGIGESLDGPLKSVQTDVLTWGRVECPAVLDFLHQQAGDLPLFWLAHSLGGQIFPLAGNQQLVKRMVAVATGSGYWGYYNPPLRYYSWWLWHVLVPLAVRLTGYFPGKRLRKLSDLPAGVIRQWRSWCLDPEYLIGAEGSAVAAAYRSVSQPVTFISLSDDEYLSRRSTEKLLACYSNAAVSHRHITPVEFDLQAIGHFGFFKAAENERLWRAVLLPELQV